jgi:Uma2 family endonuclease
VSSLIRDMPELELPIHRLTLDDVYKMVEAGVLREDDRVELLDGVLVDMTPPSADHSDAVALLNRHFVLGIEPPLKVRVQDMLVVEGGFVMPDLIVIDPNPRGVQPSTARLAVEVAVTTLRHDRSKAMRYARAGVPEYWIVDVVARELVVHRDPQGTEYRDVRRHRPPGTVSALVGAPPVDLAALLPA